MQKKAIATFSMFIIFISFSAFPLITFAQEDNDIYSTQNDSQTINNGNVYKAQRNLTVDNDVFGDLYAAGGEVTVNGNVYENMVITGGAVLVNGDVYNDLTVAGGTVILNGRIYGDLRIFAGQVYINSESINGDLFVAAGKVSIGKDVQILGKEMLNSDEVTRNATNNPENLVNYKSNLSMFKENSAKIINISRKVNNVFSLIWDGVMFFGTLLTAYVILRLFPVFSEETLKKMKQKPVKSFLFGAITFVVAPPILLVLMFTFIGIKLAMLLGLLGVSILVIASYYANYSVGRMILKQLGKINTGRLFPLIVGFVAVEFPLFILKLIPLLGRPLALLITFVLLAWSLGAMISNKFENLSYRAKGKK